VLALVGYAATWLLAVWVLDLAIGAVAAAVGWLLAIALAVGVGAAWQLSPRKWRAIRQCSRTVPLAPRGWRADRDCLHLGLLTARACVVACGGLMLVAAAAGHGVLAIAALAAVQLRERVARRPDPRPGVLAIAAVGALAVASAAARGVPW
jgi:hypothetical protein